MSSSPRSSLFSFSLLFLFSSLLFSFCSCDTQLFAGAPLSTYLSLQSTAYYFVDLTQPGIQGNDIVINVTPLGPGDPDVYASLTDVHPTQYSRWVARAYGEDSIVLSASDFVSSSTLYVAVFAFRATNFTITVDANTPITLIDGFPQLATVHVGAVKHFIFNAPSRTLPFYISAVATSGLIGLYMSNSASGVFPTPSIASSYQWPSSSSPSFSSSFSIQPNDPLWPQSNTFYITVSNAGFSSATFTLSTSQNASLILRDGVPVTAQLNTGVTAYYSFVLTLNDATSASACGVTFSVTPLTGDPDLYSSHCDFNGGDGGVCNRQPSASNFEQRSIRSGADEIAYNAPAHQGIYYIGVLAWRASTFTLQASTVCGTNNHTIDFSYLIQGQPQSGTMSAGSTRYYKLIVSQLNLPITFSLSRRYGDPDLYIRRDDSITPGPNSYQWQSTYSGDDLVTISPTDANACTTLPCVYYVAVYAFTDTSFSLTAASQSITTILQAGVPISDTLTAGAYEYFTFIYDQPGRPITVSVTDLGRGDPDLYISTVSPTPNATNYQWASTFFSSDSVTIPPTDPLTCRSRCTFYVSVFAFQSTTFTIIATYEDAAALIDGVTQNGVVTAGESDYYFIDVSPGYQALTFTLSISNGGFASIFVASNGTYPELSIPSSYQFWVPYYLSSRVLTIQESDSKACVPAFDSANHRTCRYIVAVNGVSNSSYSLLGYTSTGNFAVPLLNGQAQSGRLNSRQWQYFSVRVDGQSDGSMQDLTVIVTAISGDPDLYVTNVTANARVNATTAQWSATRYGTDTIDIDNVSPGTYYIGVLAYSANTSFTILALIQSEVANDPRNRIVLYDGQPQQGSLHQRRYQYYSFQVPAGIASFEISATKLFGDPDLYVTLPGDTVPPSLSHFAYRSTGGGSDLLRIASPVAGVWTIAVYAYSTSLYTISATIVGGLVQLQDGIPFRATLPEGQYRDFFITVNAFNLDLSVVLTSFNGDPDLYIATYPFPRIGNFTWSSINWLDDSITIPSTDLQSCENSQSSSGQACVFYFSVYSFTASSFAITASFSSYITLQDGTPQSGAVQRGLFKYYALTPAVNDGMTSLSISVSPLNGNPSLYVSTVEHPTTSSFQAFAIGYYSGANLVLTPDSPAWCTPSTSNADGCIYYIGVYGETDTNFTVSATSSASSYMLQVGRPVRDFLVRNAFDYYAFDVATAGLDLMISVTAITGDPDLYISRYYPHPNMTASEWSSRSSGGDAIIIPQAAVSRYYIAVQAYTNTTFTILATTYYSNGTNSDDDAQQLVDGVPQNGIMPQGVLRYFVFELSGQHGTFIITLTRRLGDPDLYVSMNVKPTTRSYQWSSTQSGQDIITIYNPAPGRYFIAVYGYTTCDYTIVAKSSSSALALINGVPFRSDLQVGRWQYFVLPVDDSSSGKDLTISLTALNGDPDIYVSRIYERPNATASEYRSLSYQSDAITIPSRSLIRGAYYIGVTAFTNCSYIIVADFNARVRLSDGTPQADNIVKLQMKYYTIRVSNLIGSQRVNNLTVSVTPTQGRVYLYMSATTDPVFGSPSSYSWFSTRASATQTFTAVRGSAGFCTLPICDYIIMVYGVRASSYSLVASTGGASIELQNGRPTQGSVSLNAYSYYAFTANNPRAAITITLTPSSGDPDLYVNQPCTSTPIRICPSHPSSTQYTWASIYYGGDAVHVDYLDTNFGIGTYTIAVFGSEASQYTITAIVTDLTLYNNSVTFLVDGQQQTGFSASSSDPRFFIFYVPPAVDTNSVTVSFTVTPRYGDPDIYVNTGLGMWPSSSSYTWKSEYYGRDAIVVDNSCTDCYYVINVQAYTKSLFDIVATSGITQLLSGVPHLARVVQGTFNYYYLELDYPDVELVFTLTSLTGDPDLYIDDRDSVQRPNQTWYKWASLNSGSDVVNIVSPHAGFYYASVFGFSNSSYILTATVGPLYLVDSEPHSDILTIGDTRLYSFTYSDPTHTLPLNIVIDMQNGGAVDFFVCNNCTFPSPTVYQWAVRASDPVRNILVIPPTDDRTCVFTPPYLTTCPYKIAVVGRSRAIYSITAAYSEIPQLLIEGTPVTTDIEAATYKYYRAIIDNIGVDLNIDVTEYVGDVQVFASFDVKPNASHYMWSSGDHSTSRGDHLGIPHTDALYIANAVPGKQIYIAVLASVRSRYSIVATTLNQLLLIGQPAIASLDYNTGSASFVFNLDSETAATDLVFTIGTANNNQNILYPMAPLPSFTLYIINNSTVTTKPDATNAYWSKDVVMGGSFTILKNDPRTCITCTYYITVVGTSRSQFTLTASTDANVDLLFDNSVITGTPLLSQSYKYYEIYIAAARNLTVTVETCSGNADLYISQTTRHPTSSNFYWRSINSDSIDTVAISENILDNSFFIGVLGNAPVPSTYLVHARTSADSAHHPVIPFSLIAATSNTANTIQVRFSLASSGRGDPTNRQLAANLKYWVYYQVRAESADSASSTSWAMYSECGLTQTTLATSAFLSSDTSNPATAPGQTVSVTIDQLDPSKFYEINVLVQDIDPGTLVVYGSSVYTVVVSSPLSDSPGSSGDSSTLRLLLIVGIPVVILVIALAAYLFVKNRRLTQELSIEMGDVPKQVLHKVMRGPPSTRVNDEQDEQEQKTQTKNYSRLLPDEENDYKPPAAASTSTSTSSSSTRAKGDERQVLTHDDHDDDQDL